MRTGTYRQVLAQPGIALLMLLGFFSKIAVVAIPVVMNLAVVFGLHRGFGAAGLVIAVWTVGVAVGGPIQGRMMDRYGARPVLAVCLVGQLLFWGLGPSLPYGLLMAGAVVSGLLNLPGFSIVRLRLAVAVPEELRHTAFALDAMTSNISYMVGPALGVTIATSISSTVSMRGLGLVVAIAGVGLWLLNPQVRDATKTANGKPPKVPVRDWLKGGLIPVLAATTATTLATSGYETAIVGGLRESGQVGWSGLVLTVCGFCSLLGALTYGMLKKPPIPAAGLAALVGLTTLIGGFATSDWRLLCLAMVLPAGLCSPSFASTGAAASALAPAGSRGLVMGVYSAAMTLGNSVGAPLSGAVLDARSPVWAFTVIGLASAGLALLGLARSTYLARNAVRDGEIAPALADTAA
ncbi:MFS transporter [Streptomyces sp. NBC_01089]|uniref:MFS transporter n=1 Tax=Streptomyces sp. NBC_01089 TaxID=2903747 RepID=UPI0038644BDB|nr:MFS transporter [Streptomyces sp. NBC_01089]